MKKLYMLLINVVCIQMLFASDASISGAVKLDDKKLHTYEISDERVIKAPIYNPKSGLNPPFSVGEASKVAAEKLKHYVKDISQYALKEVILTSVDIPKGDQEITIWYWVVVFRNKSLAMSSIGPLVEISVLMDGYTPSLKEEKEKE